MSFADRLEVEQASSLSSPQVAINSLAATLVDLIDCGLCICDVHGVLLHANRAAKQEFANRSVLTVVDGIVRTIGTAQAELLAALRDAAQRQKNRLLLIGEAQDRLAVVTTPIALVGTREHCVLLMLGQRTLCSPIALEMMASRHDLTHMERRVLCGLLANRSPREIAAVHKVSLPTVRTQIQSLREKIGVHSVDELLLFAARIPPVSRRIASLAA